MEKQSVIYISALNVPPDEEKFNRWINEVHHPLLFKHPALREIRRYNKLTASTDQPQSITVYEFDSRQDLDEYLKSPERQAAIDEVKESWPEGLTAVFNAQYELVKTFSGGMLKRLSIVCALVHKPVVLFLDEITVGLDTPLRREMWDLLQELKKDSTIVISTHYIPDAENYCDRVALMFDGHILDCGRPAELVEKYPAANSLEEVTLICQK